MIAQELEVVLHNAFVGARAKRHEFITVEHLLLAVLDSPNAAAVLTTCGANVQELRESLSQHIVQLNPADVGTREIDTLPTQGFQRVIQSAILKVQSSAKKEVGSLDVLLAIFGQRKSYAVQLLERHSVTQQAVASRMNEASEALPETRIASPALDLEAPIGGAISQGLEVSLHRAFVEARERRDEFITVEHLLLVLLDNPVSAEILRACGADMEALRGSLTEHIMKETPRVPTDREVDTQPTLGFERVLQRAILHVQSTSAKEVTGANVLVALFGEKDSHALYFLAQQGITRLNVVTYISHGVVPASEPPSAAVPADASEVQVVLYNDDYTPMEFVVRVLQEFFGMSKEDAAEAMLDIHRDGAAVCGLYSREDGAALVQQVLAFAHKNGHPLTCATVVPK